MSATDSYYRQFMDVKIGLSILNLAWYLLKSEATLLLLQEFRMI